MSVPELSNDVVLTVAETARLAKVSQWLIRQEIKAESLHARRIGTCIRITRVEFDRWLRVREWRPLRPPTPPTDA